jgi:hypothetical protein
MELLAIGGLAYIGTILNQHVTSLHDNTKENNDKEKFNDEKFAFFNKRDYQNKDLNKIEKKYKKRVKEIKDLSFIPEKSKVIPSFYNQIPSVGEQFEKQNLPIPGRLDNSSADKMFSLDDQFKLAQISNKNPVASGHELDISQNWTPFADGGDMTYGIYDKDDLKHNNMQPFHRKRDDVVNSVNGKMVDEINSNNNQTKMELFTGSSKNYYPKEAPPPFFEPMKDVHFVNGIPAMTDKFAERMTPGNNRNGEKPFQPIQVQPGLGLGYNEDSKVGFHDSYRAPQPTIDSQRVGNRMQKSNPGVMIPGMKGQKQPVDPNVAKRRPEKVFDASNYIHGAGNGGVSKPAINPEEIVKEQQRETTTAELKNGMSQPSGSRNGPFNPDGKKRNPHKKQYDGPQPVGPSLQSQKNNNLPSYQLLENQRTETTDKYYDGVPSNATMNKGTVFNTQAANATMRQTTAETAQDGVAHGGVRKGNQFNTQPAKATMRQTIEGFDEGPAHGGIRKGNQFNTQAANATMRQTTAETSNDGIVFGAVRKGTQFNTQPTNPTLRQTIEGFQEGPAHGDIRQVHQYNTQAANSTMRQLTAEPANDGIAFGDIRKGHQFNTQAANPTMRQTTSEPANDGIAFGDIRKGHQFNTQPANSTMRQTIEGFQEGPAHGDIRQVHQFNTQAANSTMRQLTAETVNDGVAHGGVRKVHQYNTQPANATMRQNTNETPQDGPAHGGIRKVHQFNTQPANSTMRQLTAETENDGVAHGGVRKVHQFNTQPTNATLRQLTTETAQDGPASHMVPKTTVYNDQPANPTNRQSTNYENYMNPARRMDTTEVRSRSDANNMTTHSSREDTTVGRTLTYSGWNEGISSMTHGEQNSKERDVNNNWTRVNPPSSRSRNNGLQDMDGFNLDDRIIFQLNKLKDMPSMGDRIENTVTQVLQNNELINNAFQKYKGK